MRLAVPSVVHTPLIVILRMCEREVARPTLHSPAVQCLPVGVIWSHVQWLLDAMHRCAES